MSMNNSPRIVRLVLAAGLLLGAGAFVQAQQNETRDSEGNVVQIGRADEEVERLAEERLAKPDPTDGAIIQQELPKYWIGLLGGGIPDDHVLRAHLDLPSGEGVLVENVVPDSPAGKAGLKRYDILLRANDNELREMQDLVELVRTEGEKEGQIAIEVLRHGERETVYVTPEERPAAAGIPQPQGGDFGGQFPQGLPNEIFRQLEREGMPFNFRNFGPGVIIGGGRGMANMPNGVSISVQKNEGEPTRISVKRGDETWEVTGDDPESLDELPDDLRPFVERMLRNDGAGGSGFQMPNIEGFEGRLGDERLQERLEQMERRMEEMQRRLFPDDRRDDQRQAEDEQAEETEEN